MLFQATFAHRCTQYAAILTSVPLLNIGILDVTVMPDGYFCYGASGGREWYVDASKKFKDTSIAESELALLEVVGEQIGELLELAKYQHFTWVGSGLQKHYGHMTIAKQDCYGSIDESQSHEWTAIIAALVHKIDPIGSSLEMRETDTDIKVYLKAKLSGLIFDKGHGIRLFAQQMALDLRQGNVLVCGDSETDLSMLGYCLALNPHNTFTVWVTRNPELRQQVTALCNKANNHNYVFVSCPQVILAAMAQATIREVKIRPTDHHFYYD